MAKFISEFYDLVSFIEGKPIASKRPPEQVDSALYFVIVDVFNHYIDHYVKTKKISHYLTPFKKIAPITFASGASTLPPDYELHREFYGPTGNRVPLVEDAFWDYESNRKVGPRNSNNPIARIENSTDPTPIRQIQIFPTSVASGSLLYFRTPTKPKWAYTAVGSKYVYDDASSIDMDFRIQLYPDLINRVLSIIGVNLREGQLVQMMQAFKMEEQIK